MTHELKDCPFCGMSPDLDEPDTLHPSGIYWRVTDGIKHYIRFKDRQYGDQTCYVFNCVETSGGCGVEIHGDTKEECLTKWNTRINTLVSPLATNQDKGKGVERKVLMQVRPLPRVPNKASVAESGLATD